MAPVEAPPFSSVYADEIAELVTTQAAEPAPEPRLVLSNRSLADELGIGAWLASDDAVAVLAGNELAPGAKPVAMAYAGHQFGGYSPLLGDGRALLLGELSGPDGKLVDVHLKGSGRTPFARGGDGKATLSAMLREYVIAEAMHALGVPTARALAVIATGDVVMRERPEPGAVLARVAASHIRVGTFEFAARREPDTLLRRLADHTIARHHPDLAGAEHRHLELLRRTVEAQAALIAKWMLVGFIHGVMNTDNTLLSGETIDYGPCAFLEHYDPAAVFSSIDHGGRYAYRNQPGIALWNLARLAETLLPLIDDDRDEAIQAATGALDAFASRYEHHFDRGMAAKLGFGSTLDPGDDAVPGDPGEDAVRLGEDLLAIMERERADFTNTFRALAASLRGDRAAAVALLGDGFGSWETRWHRLLDGDRAGVADEMDMVNPLYVPRNHLVEEALAAATAGDIAPIEELLAVVTAPFSEREGAAKYSTPAPAGFTDSFRTFCGT